MMTSISSTPLRAGLAAVTLILTLAAFAGAETYSRSFDVRDGGRLEVDTDVGSIEIRAAGSGRVEIEVEVSGSRADELELDFSQDGDNVTVRGDFPRQRGWFNWGSSGTKVEYVITVPERYDIDLDTAGGSIEVSDLEGEVRAETSGGSLSFGRIRGPLRADTSGGPITLEGSQGDVELETSGGPIKIGDVHGTVKAHTSGGAISIERARGRVDAETSGGAIRVDEVMGTIRAATSGGPVTAYISEQPEDDCRLTTSGGPIVVYLADGLSFELDAEASGGRVESDFEVTGGRRSKTSLSGAIGGGGPKLYLRSSGGGVRIERR